MKSLAKFAIAVSTVLAFSSNVFAADIKADIQGMSFKPGTITVSVGDTITFTNRDGAPHTATASDGSFTTATLRKGQSETVTFNTAGTFAFFCKVHPGMKGTIVVK